MWSKSSGRDKAPESMAEPIVTPRDESSPLSGRLPRNEPQVKIGKTIVVRGELSGEEDLTVEGRVEGKIRLEGHHLTIGETGKISAEVVAKTVNVIGQMEGNLFAKEKVEISDSGSLTGDIRSPRVIIADGAKFKGSVDMSGGEGPEGSVQPSSPKPEGKEGVEQRRPEEVAAKVN